MRSWPLLLFRLFTRHTFPPAIIFCRSTVVVLYIVTGCSHYWGTTLWSHLQISSTPAQTLSAVHCTACHRSLSLSATQGAVSLPFSQIIGFSPFQDVKIPLNQQHVCCSNQPSSPRPGLVPFSQQMVGETRPTHLSRFQSRDPLLDKWGLLSLKPSCSFPSLSVPAKIPSSQGGTTDYSTP